MTNSTQSKRNEKPAKPYDDFPLFPHANGCWAKKIRGKFHFFGSWRSPEDGWQDAIESYQVQRDDLHAGRVPRPSNGGVTVADCCNEFLANRLDLVSSGELTERSFADYKATALRVARVLGRNRVASNLSGTDFGILRADIANTRGPASLKNEIVRVRCIFNFAYKHELIDSPIRYGAGFDPPKRKVVRKAFTSKGLRMFEANELRCIIEACGIHLKAMVLLSANSGMGNHDIGCIPISAANFDTGWVDFPREKTGTPRRFPMWPETISAIKESLLKRRSPQPGHEPFLFITRKGEGWAKSSTGGTLSREFKKVLDSTGIYRDGLGFYCLRRGFQTIGEEAGETATRYIMGHVNDSMSATYRQRISNERLKAVTDHVHSWLYAD